jgi:preprotein translocase subunit SecY
MAYCLNPECPHKKKIGRPAEFREGITHCSDCGSLLSEEVIEKEEGRKKPPRIVLTDLQKRILYTLGFVLIWRVLLLIPVPGINLQVLGGFLSYEEFNHLLRFVGFEPTLERFSILALGVMPYISAYMIVEILSVFIQPLKSWRDEGYQGRIKIKRVALFAIFLFALIQGYGIAISLEHMTGPAGGKIVLNPGMSFRLLLCITMIAGTYLTIWIADLISRKGIGHGISILIFAKYGRRFFSNIPQIKWVPYKHSSSEYFLLFALIVIALIALIVLMEKSYRKIPVRFSDGVIAYIPLKLTSAGIIPASGGEWLIGLPTTILGFTAMMGYQVSQKLSEALLRGSIWHYMAYAIIIIFFYYLLVSFFYNPKDMVTFLKNKTASILSPLGKNEESYIDKSLESMIPIAALYLCVVLFVPNAIFDLFLDFHLDGIALIVAVAILFDLIEEIHLRRGNNLVKVAELHDVPMAGLVKSLFEQKGLPCYLRGYYHRALLYFFGPYIEISVLVPEDKIIDATEVIENYLDANILTVQSGRVSEFL